MTNVGFVIARIIAVILLSWLVISPLVVVWWHFRPDNRKEYIEKREWVAQSLYIGAFLSLIIVLLFGFKEMLFFIPSNWGGFDEDAKFVSARTQVAGWLAVSLSIFVAYLCLECESQREELKKLHCTEDELPAAKDAAYHAERRAEFLEGRIRAIMIRLEDLGVKEMYDELERAEDADADAWIEQQLALLEEQEEEMVE
jgi:hypothetical protein